MSENKIEVSLRQISNYQFAVDFGAPIPELKCDEPAPLGEGEGPSPVKLLAAAVGNCLSDSLFFALKKFKQDPHPITCHVVAEIGRNSEGRMRVLKMDVRLMLGVEAASLQNLERILGSFEAYCTVSQSVAQGIPIQTNVFDSVGIKLK